MVGTGIERAWLDRMLAFMRLGLSAIPAGIR
jgi:hypothetical protein